MRVDGRGAESHLIRVAVITILHLVDLGRINVHTEEAVKPRSLSFHGGFEGTQKTEDALAKFSVGGIGTIYGLWLGREN
jgi:hypothetical protein